MAVAFAAVLVAAWVLCAVSYATHGGGSDDAGDFTLFGLVAVALTTAAGIAISEAWKRGRGIVAAPALAVLAVASVLWLALALRLGG